MTAVTMKTVGLLLAACFAGTSGLLARVSNPPCRWNHKRHPSLRTRASTMSIAHGSSLIINAEAAFAASALATVMLHPLDTIKCRLQSDAYTLKPPVASLRRSRPTPDAPRQKLLSGLYAGLGENVMKEAPDAAVFLALSEAMTSLLTTTNPWFASHLTYTLLLSGAFGDACGSILRLPAEVCCKRQQMGLADGFVGALADTSRDRWVSSWAAILVRDVPMGALQIAAYQQAKCWIWPACSAFNLSPPDTLSDVIAGVLAGAIAAALTTPFDVLVTHATTAPDQASGPPRGALQMGRDLVREQGPWTLLRGLGYRTLYYAPLVGCFFGMYEYFRVVLENV